MLKIDIEYLCFLIFSGWVVCEAIDERIDGGGGIMVDVWMNSYKDIPNHNSQGNYPKLLLK